MMGKLLQISGCCALHSVQVILACGGRRRNANRHNFMVGKLLVIYLAGVSVIFWKYMYCFMGIIS